MRGAQPSIRTWVTAREAFSFDETMRMIGMFAGLLPAGVDLGPDRVAALWRQAMKF